MAFMADDLPSTRKKLANPLSPTMRDLVAVMFRQRRLALGAFLVGLGLTLTYALLAPSYQAHMKILVRRGRVDPFVTSEQNAPAAVARPEISEEELNSEVELLRDQSLLRQVVEQNGLASTDSRTTVDQKATRVARAVRRLAGNLEIAPIRKTNLILVSYDNAAPESAARVLRTLARLYVEKHKEVGRSSEEFPFFEQQADQSRTRLGQAESRVLDFSRERGVVSGALERDLALQRTGEIENGYQQVRVAIQETSRRSQALQAQLNSLPERSTSVIRTADNPQLLEILKGKLLELELKRTELLTKFQPSYQLVREIEQQIEQAKAAIVAERLAPLREETTDRDSNYEWAKLELGKTEVELAALRTREQAVNSELAASRAQARQLGEMAIQQQDLVRNMKTAEESYLLYARKSEEARISDALDQRGIVNVVLAEPPVAPVLPKHSFWFWLGFGLSAAGAGSLATAFAADYMDPALRTPDEVVALLQVPVLASLPRGVA